MGRRNLRSRRRCPREFGTRCRTLDLFVYLFLASQLLSKADAVCGQPWLLFQVSGTGSCSAINLPGRAFIIPMRQFFFLFAAGTAPPTHVVRAEAAAQLFLAPSVIRSCYFTPIVSQRWAEPQSKLEVPSCMFLVVSALLIHRCVSFVLLIVLLSLLYTPMFLVLSHFSFRGCHYSTRP